ncbi:hypothetical protein AOCH_005736, partial [Aspergillus ochraceoroseus]
IETATFDTTAHGTDIPTSTVTKDETAIGTISSTKDSLETATLDSTTHITETATFDTTVYDTERPTSTVTKDETTVVTKDETTIVTISSTKDSWETVTLDSTIHIIKTATFDTTISQTVTQTSYDVIPTTVSKVTTETATLTSLVYDVATTSNSYGYGTVSALAGPITLSAGPTATLTPIDPPGVNMGGTGVLTPTGVAQVWYSGDNSSASNSNITYPYVRLNLTFEYESIILDQSIYIENVLCFNSNTSLTGTFDNVAAFDYAATTWPTDSDVILITAASGCSFTGQNIYFLSSSITFDASTDSFVATGSVENIADLVQTVGVDFGDLTYDNSTSSSNSTDYGCTSPSSSTVNGLPAVACGPDFDEALDNVLGYYSGADADTDSTLAALAPGAASSSQLTRRSWWSRFKHAIKSVASAVVHAVKTVAAAVVTVVKTVVKEAVAVVETVAKYAITVAETEIKLVTFLVTGQYHQSFNFPLNIGPPSALVSDSPWGDQGIKFWSFKLDDGDDDDDGENDEEKEKKKEKFNAADQALDDIKDEIVGDFADPEPGIDLWCVNCGVTGDFKVTGTFAASIRSGFTKGQLSLAGNMYAGLFIGVDAFMEFDDTETYSLFTLGLPGFEIPDIVALGPTLSLGVSAELDITAEGQYLAGAGLTWPSIYAMLDVLDHANSVHSGFTPTYNETVSSEATITVTSTLGLPVTLGFGLNVLNGKWEKEARLIDTPGLQATLEYDDDISYTDGALNVTPADGCYGVSWDLALVNNVVLDLSDFDEGTYTLASTVLDDIASGCIGKDTSTTTTTTTTTSATPTATPSTIDIKYFMYGNLNETAIAEQNVWSADNFVLVTGAMTPTYTDPWNGMEKSITMLFEVKGTTYVFIAPDDGSTYFISPDDPSANENVFTVTPSTKPSGANIQIICAVWGMGMITADTLMTELYNYAASGAEFQWSNSFFGTDTWLDYHKTGSSAKRDLPPAFEQIDVDVPVKSKREMVPVKSRREVVPVHHHKRSKASPEKRWFSPFSGLSRRSDNITASSNSTDDQTGAVIITDTTDTLYLNPHVNGNLFVTLVNSTTDISALTNGTEFAADTTAGIVMGDTDSRLLYYFPGTMNETGVSRIRLGAWGEIPETAQLVSLVPFSTGSDEILVAVDTQGQYSFLFVCALENQVNKVFLVQDPTTGAATLESADLMYTVVGGAASDCVPLAMVAGGL